MGVIGDGRMRNIVKRQIEMLRMKHQLVVILSLILMDVAMTVTILEAAFFPAENAPYMEEVYPVQAAMSVRISVIKVMTT